ncbi:MAG TPA: RluA family pseudouridine synthase [Candidatus Saccharimonadales bacterium]|nr:RluA family pseudouridine synthase [Candidatus Saccharimonadales bacterium]
MLDLKILYEDDDILVINKDAGIVVNTSQTSPQGTVQETLADKIETDSEDEASEFDQRTGIVHRIDKDTSGILLIAKNKEAFIELQRQFKEREVKKEYLALVLGQINEEVVEINAPIKRHPFHRTKLAVVEGGKDSVTKVEKIKDILKNGEKLTLVKVNPLTGRTHQIRVHLAAFNHPIVGDELYSSTKQYYKWHEVFGRLMLHACKIEISHPTTHKIMMFEAPLPQEFIDL